MVGPGFSRCPNCGLAIDGKAGAATVAARSASQDAPTVMAGPPSRTSSGAHIFIKAGPDQGRLFPLKDLVTVGRGSGCEVRLSDPHVSTKHAQIKREGAVYTYLDLRSTGGSFLQMGGHEERLRDVHSLGNNDELRLGDTILQFIRTPQGDKR
jgi:pSer/pThr/pTyr-binding forkhead associated (FHA) protein